MVCAAVLVAAGGSAWWYQAHRLPKRFAPVVPNHLYRSGEVTPAQLERLHREYGIERVVCLLDSDAPQTQAEQAAAAQLGVEWHNVPLGGDGASAPEERERLLTLLDDPHAPPTLVHCAAGVNRTGLAVGLYRIHAQGWDYDAVLQELRQFDFDDLPKHENLRSALRDAAARASTQPAPP